MKLTFPRYFYGMLKTPDMENVYGGFKPLAYNEEFSENLQREVYKNVRLELNEHLLGESGNAYGFFPLPGNDFVAAHFELMKLTELSSRGRPVFSEYIYITSSQLAEIGWNLYPIFNSFESIPFYEKVTKDIQPVNIDFDSKFVRLIILRKFPVQVKTILVRYLSSSEKTIIISGPSDHYARLRIFCTLILCLPERYRKDMSFATLAKDTSESARLFFSNQLADNGKSINWQTPTVPNMPGKDYAEWVTSFLDESNNESLLSENSKSKLVLPIPEKSTHLRSFGEQLDLAISHKEWLENSREYVNIKTPEQLEQVLNKIYKFSCLYTDRALRDWLSLIFPYVVKLNAYEMGVDALAYYSELLLDKNIRLPIAQKIAREILPANESNLNSLATFLAQINQHAQKTNKSILIEFCKEILISFLSSNDYQAGLKLWNKTRVLVQANSWVNSVDWFCDTLSIMAPAQAPDDFIFIVNEIGCPAQSRAFTSLLGWLQRSPKLSKLFTENVIFLENHSRDTIKEYLGGAQKCFFETKSYIWLNTQLQFAVQHYPNTRYLLPDFLKTLGLSQAEKLLSVVISTKDSRLIAVVVFSTIRNGIYPKNTISAELFNMYISLCQGCSTADIKYAVEILSGYWKGFSLEYLEIILTLLQQKSDNFGGLATEINAIQDVIQHEKRMQDVRDLSRKKIDFSQLPWITNDFVQRFVWTADVEAWNSFVDTIKNRKRLRDYQSHLASIMLNNNAFNLGREQIRALVFHLKEQKLYYEADLFIYRLIFLGDSSINPSQSLLRTLDFKDKDSVNPSIAGSIISYNRSFDNKYVLALAGNMVNDDFENAKKFVSSKSLTHFLEIYPINPFQAKMESWFIKPTDNDIFIMFLKTLSSQIRLELQKAEKH